MCFSQTLWAEKTFPCTLGLTAVIGSSTAADLHEEGSLWQKHWLFVSLTWPFKMFLKTVCSKWKFWSTIPIVLFIGGRNWKTVWVFIIFIFNFKCCQAHEEVKNWVGLYNRTNPHTSANWMLPKSLLLKQVYFHELAVLFFWAGRTGLILAPLLTRLWSQFSFVLWDSLLAKRKKNPFQLSLLNIKVFIYHHCAPFTYLRKERSVVPFPLFCKLYECCVYLLVPCGLLLSL